MKVKFGEAVAIGSDLIVAARRASQGRASIMVQRGDEAPRDTFLASIDLEPGIVVQASVDMNRAKLHIEAPDFVLIRRLKRNILYLASHPQQDMVVKR